MSATPAAIAALSQGSRRDDPSVELADIARAAEAQKLGYAGIVSPQLAAQLLNCGAAQLVDVRSAAERSTHGAVPESLHIAWLSGAGMVRNPRFARELELRAAKSDVLLFICASGKRSRDAALAASKAGFSAAFNVAEGVDGDGEAGAGWRARGLPWQRV